MYKNGQKYQAFGKSSKFPFIVFTKNKFDTHYISLEFNNNSLRQRTNPPNQKIKA